MQPHSLRQVLYHVGGGRGGNPLILKVEGVYSQNVALGSSSMGIDGEFDCNSW